MATASGFSAVQRSEGRLPTPQTAIYVADTLGEIAVFFAAAPIVFVAGSLVPVGGHNPLEPCHFDCAVLFGPLMHKNAAIARRLLACGGAIEVSDAADLARQVGRLLTDPELGHNQAAAAATEARRNIDLIGTIYNQVAAFLKPSGQHHEGP
jgi:3-deoxy-D-manno-octulosonic-acid transferase